MEKGNDSVEKTSAVFYSSSVINGTCFSYYNTTFICVYSDGNDDCLFGKKDGDDNDKSSWSKQFCMQKKEETDSNQNDSIRLLFLSDIFSPSKA